MRVAEREFGFSRAYKWLLIFLAIASLGIMLFGLDGAFIGGKAADRFPSSLLALLFGAVLYHLSKAIKVSKDVIITNLHALIYRSPQKQGIAIPWESIFKIRERR